MSPRTRGRFAWSCFLLGAALLAGGLALAGGPEDPEFIPVIIAAPLAYGGVGALVVSRKGNAVGWILLAVGVGLPALAFAEAYATRGIEVAPGSLPFPTFAAWLGGWGVIPLLEAVPLLILLFPDGVPPSRRWRPLAWAIGILTLLGVLGAAFSPNNPLSVGRLRVPNPAVPPLEDLSGPMLLICGVGSIVAFVLSVASLIMRFRRATGEEREQLRWLAYVGVLGLTSLAALFSTEFFALPVFLSDLLFWLTVTIAAVAIPAACGIAILKHRLYDIDVVIKKTVVYGLLAGFVTVVYVGVVVALGVFTTESLAPSILATALVAGLFQPVRGWATRLANRLVFGQRAEPYEVLARFSDRVAETYSTDDVLVRMARVIAEGTGAEWAGVWTRVGDDLHRAAVWPAGEAISDLEAADRTVEVRHQGERLGTLAVKKVAAEPLTPTEDKLLADLASQAGLVLRNLGLAAELRARVDELSSRSEELRDSRVRIVRAHDAERRRLERNIHDGAQQHLVALAVKLRLARSLAAKDPVKAAEMLHNLRDQTDLALETLLDLASGIYPAALEERGIGAALKEHAGGAGPRVSIDADGLPRLPVEAEAAVYFCCLEAMQNAAKYARATHVKVRIARNDGLLSFSVSDDGAGFDAALAESGSGLRNMRDRLAAFGGEVEIDSRPGVGTTVRGHLPVSAPVEVAV